MEDQALLADYVAAASSFLGALQAVTDLGVVRADLIIPHPTEGWAATAGSNVDTGGTFVGFIEDGNGKKASHKLPGVKPSTVDTDGSIPITGVIDTYLSEFEDGEDFNLSDGEQIDTWIRGALDR